MSATFLFIIGMFPLVLLGAGQLVDLWFQSTLFATRRRAIKQRLDDADAAKKNPPWHARLLSCVYCLSHWPLAMLILLCVLPGILFPAAAPYLALPVLWLAGVRVNCLLDGLLPARLQHLYESEFVADSPVTYNTPAEVQTVSESTQPPQSVPTVPEVVCQQYQAVTSMIMAAHPELESVAIGCCWKEGVARKEDPNLLFQFQPGQPRTAPSDLMSLWQVTIQMAMTISQRVEAAAVSFVSNVTKEVATLKAEMDSGHVKTAQASPKTPASPAAHDDTTTRLLQGGA